MTMLDTPSLDMKVNVIGNLVLDYAEQDELGRAVPQWVRDDFRRNDVA